MGIRRGKTTAIVFVVLFLGYYQRWLYVPIYEAITGQLSLDPAIPSLLEHINSNHAKQQLTDNRSNSGGGTKIKATPSFRKIVDPQIEIEANKLSVLLQRQLELSQRAQNLNLMIRGCKQPKVICGVPVDCNLGCQIHHVMTCLMIAHVTNRTVIMNWENWPYAETSWADIFLPIGASDCPIDNDTATVLWSRTGIDLSYPEMTTYPFKSGLPIPFDIEEKLKKIPTNHFIWWTGQFAKFVLRLQLSEDELMKKLKTAMKFYLPTVGILIRKRDKLGEKKTKNAQSIDRYMTAARKYFSKLEELIPSVTRRVFIATDDRNVVKLVRKRYRPPKWDILGFQLKTDVEDLVKDIYMLSECDFVICSFSADICRLVLELKESRTLNSSDRVKSIDQKYFSAVPGYKRLQFNIPKHQ